MTLKDLPPPSGQPRAAAAAPATGEIDLSSLTITELVTLRSQIDARLPGRSLVDVSIEEELLLQMATAKQLQRDTLADDDTPANQKAQVVGQLTTVLGQIAKLQNDTYDSERMKRSEGVLIDWMREQPMEVQLAFLAEYEKRVAHL